MHFSFSCTYSHFQVFVSQGRNVCYNQLLKQMHKMRKKMHKQQNVGRKVFKARLYRLVGISILHNVALVDV